ncbi:hypothetical protein [Desertibaculum subflavum]|uniref:hypothetical protein n=1 Tax=Desertibaculum subflavum TaxID=2268458 RepID=UPI000E6628D8
MAKQTILWTVLPHGRVEEGPMKGRRRVSVVVSPRLTPQAADEQVLKAFPEFLDWPATLAAAKFRLVLGPVTVGLIPLNGGDSTLWGKLFDADTPVAGFQFKDMSKVNLRSFQVRNVLGFLRRHYGRLAVQSTANHPTLLPWRNAHPDLKGMLGALGTRTQKFNFGDRSVEVALPGFSRFFNDDARDSIEGRLKRQVFAAEGLYRVPVPAIDAPEAGSPPQAGDAVLRVLPADWHDPAGGGPDAGLMSQFAGADEYAFYQADRFYRREPPSDAQRKMRRPSYQDIPAPPKVPDYDFHRTVASYADYPLLLRALGLIVDCALEDDGPIDAKVAAGGGTGKGLISLQIGWASNHNPADDTTPRTAWTADKERFFTRPRRNEFDRGLLRLEQSDDGWGVKGKDKPGLFDIYQVDPDGASLKTVGFTLSAQNLVAKSLSLRQIDGEVTYTTGDKQPVAALRSGGLGVSKHGRATQVAQDAAAAALKNHVVDQGNGGNVVFFAEDVLRGYRIDVAPVPDPAAPGKWLTLCARAGNYRLIEANEILSLPPDEGYVSGASTSSTASANVDPDDHYLHESLFRWTGWSLCTPRPGLVLRAKPVDDTQLQAEEPTQVKDEAANGNGLAVEFKALKGTLPRLRFGQLYRFRARVVDLAGNSLSKDDPTLGDLEQASDAVGYWRFEPVDPPAMVQRGRLSEGESLERLVIRSNYDADTANYPATADFAAAIALPASQDFEYPPENERHLVPPKSSQQQCEGHGMFDPFFADPLTIKDGYAIAAREAGTLYDPTPGAQVELVTPASLTEVATTAAVPPALPAPDNPVGDRLRGGQYVIHREELIETPYLPDAAAGGIALRAAPGHAIPGVAGEMVLGPSCVIRFAPNQELVLLVSHRNDWPKSQGFRLILAERQAALVDLPCAETFTDAGAPVWDEDARTLTLFVAKGRIVRLVYSSFAHPALIKTFGVPHWTQNDAEREFVMGMAVMGASWMLTPFRHLTLVHTTQQPICLPELLFLSAPREIGAHHTDLFCRIVRLHGPSTGKFEIEADWHEWTDDLDKDAPERIPHKGQLGEIQLAENHVNEFNLGAAVEASRIADDDNPQGFNQERQRARGDRHDFGDTRFRLVHYRVRATTRFREYLSRALYAQRDLVTRLGPVALGERVKFGAEDDPGAPVLTDPTGGEEQTLVRATAPPDDPRVLYIVPTFRWQRSDSADTRQVTRFGNGLRVWLDRPWFSSGDGELLGVVLFGDGARFTDVPPHMQALVTQWGLDPLWDTALPKSKTSIADFAARVRAEAVPLQERPNDPLVQVVGHRVHWDAGRKLWYCDIELDPGTTYMPFVRLALVRYQPNALPNAKVSKVVLAEFAQVLPRRRAVLKRQGAATGITLHGAVPHFGPMKFPVDSEYQDISFIQGAHETGRNRVELVLQTRDPAIDSDLAWSDTATLGNAIVGEGDSGTNPGGIFAEPFVAAAATRVVQPRAGSAVRLASEVELQAAVGIRDRVAGGPVVAGPIVTGPIVTLDPPIWTATVTVPGTGGKPGRLVLREFERYYTDRTVPENRAGAVRRRRVIEERLVYAAIFDLPV